MINFRDTFVKISNFCKDNLKILISLIIFLFLIIILIQIYFYQKEQKLLKLSILYNEAISNRENASFEDKILKIAKENNFFGVLASLELINLEISKKNYNLVYEQYIELLNSKHNNDLYKSIISIHGAYNLFDYLPYDKINNLLNYFDLNTIYLKEYYYELKFLMSIKNNNNNETEKLYKNIIEGVDISNSIKERVKKIYEFNKYK